jgi:2-succinyl-5-enolpyruvyl-6-hydroxy-3-cyclohexene-1-carboxylate synthase
VSGIDGLVSGAAGAASVAGATVLLLGDVSLLHDLHGLLVAARQTSPMVIVVLANGGGRIFDTLPIGQDAARALFTTPTDHDLAALARFAGIAHACAYDAAALSHAVTAALARPGATLVEARVAPDSARTLARALPGLVAAALEAER